MARKQRQLARDAGEFVSLQPSVPIDDTVRYKPIGAVTGQRSRLVREDDENDDDDEGVTVLSGRALDDEQEREGDCETGGRFYSRVRNRQDDERKKLESDFLNAEQG